MKVENLLKFMDAMDCEVDNLGRWSRDWSDWSPSHIDPDKDLADQYDFTKVTASDADGVQRGSTWQCCPGLLTWGISPDQNTGISGSTPNPSDAADDDERKMINEALEYMKFPADMPLKGLPVQVCFVGSCTNGRISDFREVAALIKGRTKPPCAL